MTIIFSKKKFIGLLFWFKEAFLMEFLAFLRIFL